MRIPSGSTNLRRPGFPALQHLDPTPSISASRRRAAVNLGIARSRRCADSWLYPSQEVEQNRCGSTPGMTSPESSSSAQLPIRTRRRAAAHRQADAVETQGIRLGCHCGVGLDADRLIPYFGGQCRRRSPRPHHAGGTARRNLDSIRPPRVASLVKSGLPRARATPVASDSGRSPSSRSSSRSCGSRRRYCRCARDGIQHSHRATTAH
jgi:hypothetical protein